jgi:hypothetical protein
LEKVFYQTQEIQKNLRMGLFVYNPSTTNHQSGRRPILIIDSVTKTTPENRSQQYLIRIELTLP